MFAVGLLLVRMLCDFFKPRPRLEAEILILRHHLNVLQQRTPRRRPTSFPSPWQNGLVERLIGSARHECTAHVIVFNEDHRRRILSNYAHYYNRVRTHLSVGKAAPSTRRSQR